MSTEEQPDRLTWLETVVTGMLKTCKVTFLREALAGWRAAVTALEAERTASRGMREALERIATAGCEDPDNEHDECGDVCEGHEQCGCWPHVAARALTTSPPTGTPPVKP